VTDDVTVLQTRNTTFSFNFTLNKTEKACVALTYFSTTPNIHASLSKGKKPIQKFILKVSVYNFGTVNIIIFANFSFGKTTTGWTVKKMLSEHNLGSGMYNFEIIAPDAGALFLGNTRICHEKGK
jgi:hypothetical protein